MAHNLTHPDWAVKHGDTTAPATEILRTVVGSEVHGIGIEGTDDHDEMGVYIERPESVLGLSRVDHHYVARTQPEGHRSQHGDTDLVLYSLRKYLGLVTTGNPTALLPLFAPDEFVLHCNQWGKELRRFGPTLLSQHAGRRFLGYLNAQRNRLLGRDNRHVPARPELVAKYGFDTKYASHALRLGMQGLEVIRDGSLTLPLRDHQRELVLSVKRGEVELQTVVDMIEGRAELIQTLLERGQTPLPEHPDIEAVNHWLVEQHLSYWKELPSG